MSTDLEVFRRTLAHERPDRLLYGAGFVQDLRQRVIEHIGTDHIDEHYGYYTPVHVQLRPPDDAPELDFSAYWEHEDLPAGTTINGDGVAQTPSGFYHFWGFTSPLRNANELAELENYPRHDLTTWSDAHLAATVEEAHAAGKIAGAFVGHMYETAWQIRGLEPFLMDMVERPAWAECMLDHEFRNNLTFAKAAARAGVDVLYCGDDVASQKALLFSKRSWERMMLSRWRTVWQEAKAIHPDVKVWYHSDGNIIDIVEDLVDAGVDILNPLQPECLDVDEVHRRVGDRTTFDGCLGTQSTMPWGSADEVTARVKQVIDSYGRNGGLIISPTHVLEPEVPLANIDAMAAACRKFGAA